MENNRKPIYKRWWFWAIIIVLIIAIGSCSGGVDNDRNDHVREETDQATTKGATDNDIDGQNNEQGNITESVPGDQNEDTAEPTPDADTGTDGAKGVISAGMYKVGTDISPGEYLLINDSAFMSYFQVTTDSSGSLESIVANDNFYGSRYITVAENQYIEFRGAKMYPMESAPVLKAENGRYNEGMYKVGRDIPAGEYKVVPEGDLGSYLEVSSDSKGTLDSIVTNDNFTAEKYITVRDGQYIKLVGCYIQI